MKWEEFFGGESAWEFFLRGSFLEYAKNEKIEGKFVSKKYWFFCRAMSYKMYCIG